VKRRKAALPLRISEKETGTACAGVAFYVRQRNGRFPMDACRTDRRSLLGAVSLASVASLLSFSPAAAQPAAHPPIRQPGEKTRAAFFARARELRDQAAKEGDQSYGAVVVRDGIIVGEGRNYVVLESDPTAHAELLAVRDAARRLRTRDLSDCDVYSTATPCPMCQGALYWGRILRVFTESGAEAGSAPKLGC
jgi:tRNA(Arg) A34 adenosine deaminase TadA